jgi:uncharacterized peroxidase-related enzyme
MTRVQPVTPEKAKPELNEIYQGIQKNIGKIPNIFQNMGNSPAVLKGYLGLSDAMSHTSLSKPLQEMIALTVSEANQCGYCLAAHSTIAHSAGVADQDITQARQALSKDAKTQAILGFAKDVVEKKGQLNDQDIAALKKAGVNDTEIVEIILAISLTMFTNYFNHITDPKIDFPVAPKLK